MQVIGKVNADLSIKVLSSKDLGSNLGKLVCIAEEVVANSL